MQERISRALRPFHLALAVTAGIGISLANLWPCLHAQWGPVDDHEIALFLGPDQRLGLGRFGRLFLQSEAGHPGGSGRYRPSYYFVRLVETMLWGAHPERWYLARILMFGVFLASLIWVLRNRLSFAENLLLALYVATYSTWPDIWARLGPNEAYGALGVGLFVVGVQRVDELRVTSATRRQWLAALALFLLGGAIAVGAKENFLILAAPAAVVALRARRNRWALGAAAVLVAYSGFIAAATVLGVRRHGHVYREDTSVGGRLAVMARGAGAIWDASRTWALLALLLLAVAATVLLVRGRRVQLRRLMLHSGYCALAVAMIGLFYLSQYVFYNGAWPGSGIPRYDFPGVLSAPMAAYIAAYWVVALARAVELPRWLPMGGRIAVMIWVATLISDRGFPLPEAARSTARSTRGFTADLNRIADACRRNAGSPLVLDSYNVWDYEPLASMQRFMYMLGRAPTVYMKLHYRAADFAPGTLERDLTEQLERLAANGAGDNTSFLLTRPFSEFRGPPCLSMGFHGEPSAGCSAVAVFR
jgi:hypothetical protein